MPYFVDPAGRESEDYLVGGLPRRGATINGKAALADGEPITRFSVVVTGTWEDGSGFMAIEKFEDRHGRFQVHGVPRGEVRVALRNTDVPAFLQPSVSGKTCQIDRMTQSIGALRAEKLAYATVRGQVSVPTNSAVATAWLETPPYRCRWPLPVNTAFAVRIPIDAKWLNIYAEGLSDHLWKALGTGRFEVEEVVQLPPLELISTRSVSGRVVGVDGVGVAGAAVHVGSVFHAFVRADVTRWSPQEDPRGGWGHFSEPIFRGTCATDEDGCFTVQQVPPADLNFLASDGERVGIVERRSETDVLEIALEPGVRATGRVATFEPSGRSTVFFKGANDTRIQTTGILTSRDGEFVTPHLPPGEYTVEAMSLGSSAGRPTNRINVVVDLESDVRLKMTLAGCCDVTTRVVSSMNLVSLYQAIETPLPDGSLACRHASSNLANAPAHEVSATLARVPVGSHLLEIVLLALDERGCRVRGTVRRELTVTKNDEALLVRLTDADISFSESG